MNSFWDLIVKSNVFNFTILLILFVYLINKLHLGERIEVFKNEIINNLQASGRKRKAACDKLSGAKLKSKNIQSEISEKVQQINNQTSAIVNNINQNTINKIKKIENHVNTFKENEINNAITGISSKTISLALDIAKENVENKFENNSKLQEEYIEKSLEMLKKVDLPVVNNYVPSVLDIYSKALYDLDSNMSDELISVSEIVRSSKDLSELMLNPVISEREKHEVIETIFENKFSPKTVSFLKILTDNNRFSELENIVNAYLQKKSNANGYFNIKVISASDLSDEEKINVSQNISSKLNKKISVEWGVDKSIIGGLILKIGDKIFDTSVSKSISDLSKI